MTAPRIKTSNRGIKATVTGRPFVKVVEEPKKATKPLIIKEDVIDSVVETLKENPVIVPPRIVDTPSEVKENIGSRRDPVAEVVSDSARVSAGNPPERGHISGGFTAPTSEELEEMGVVSIISGEDSFSFVTGGGFKTSETVTSNTPPPRLKESSGAEQPSPGRTAGAGKGTTSRTRDSNLTGNVVNTIAREVNKKFENENIDSNNETEDIKDAVVSEKRYQASFGLIGALLLLLIVIKK